MGIWQNYMQQEKQRRALDTLARIKKDLPADVFKTRTVIETEIVCGPDIQYLKKEFDKANDSVKKFSSGKLADIRDVSYYQGRRSIIMELLNEALGNKWKGGGK